MLFTSTCIGGSLNSATVPADFNIVTYSSCMPVEAVEISRVASNNIFHHGAVCEVIVRNHPTARHSSSGIWEPSLCSSLSELSVFECRWRGWTAHAVTGFLLASLDAM